MINRRLLLLSTALFTAGGATAKAAITDSYGNAVNAIGPHTVFTGLNVSGGGGSSTLTITSIGTTGTTSSTITFNFSYTGSAPSGLTAVWQTGSIAGTISGFTATGGSGSATVTTPAAAATYTLHITGTGSNTASATAPNTTVISASPTLVLTSVPTVGLTSNSVPITFTYTGSAPSGLTALWQSGSVAGTVSGFTATGGSGSATVTTPASTASYTLHITGTGSNTASATANNTTVISTSSTITITSMPSSGSTSSTVSFNFTFTGTIPGGFTAVWQSGSVSATVSGFSTAGSTGSATVTTPASAATYTLSVTGTSGNTTSATAPNTTVVSVSSGTGAPWPGQVGNTVGFQGAPGYTGTGVMTTFSGSFAANTTYTFKIFDAGSNDTQGTNINASGVKFVGCYFGSSSSSLSAGIEQPCTWTGGGTVPTFNFCTFGPSPSVFGGAFPPAPRDYTAWPTGAGRACTAVEGYDYGPLTYGPDTPVGGMAYNNCDFWGWGNGMVFSHSSITKPVVFNNCWIHDPRDPRAAGDHQDGIGDPQDESGDTVEYLTINHCTIACVGDTQNLALQLGGNDLLNNCTITNNYWAGNETNLEFGMTGLSTAPTNFVFTGNVIGPTPMTVGAVIADTSKALFSRSGSGCQWRNNMILPGNYNGDTGNVTSGTPYIWPDNLAHSTDFTGAF